MSSIDLKLLNDMEQFLLGLQQNTKFLIKQKIEEMGEKRFARHLQWLEPLRRASDSGDFGIYEKVILASLSVCPLFTNNHFFSLFQLEGPQKRRVVREYFERCNKNQTLILQVHQPLGSPEGIVVTWYLAPKGYKTAIKLCYPDKKIPRKCPRFKPEETKHNMLIADIFCEVFKNRDPAIIWDQIEKINWLPRHEFVLNLGEANFKENDLLIPDGIVAPLNQSVKIFLEVDRNTKSLKQEKEKLKKYATYFELTEEQTKIPSLILYSVDSGQRGKAIKDLYDKEINPYKDFAELRYYQHNQAGEVLKKMLDHYVKS